MVSRGDLGGSRWRALLTTARRAVEAALSLDLRSLALFRALFGAVIFADTLAGLRGLPVFFTDQGVLPREAALHLTEAQVGLSLHFLSGGLFCPVALALLTAAAALSFAVGYQTRAATIALWALTLSTHIRNPLVLQGSDYITRVLLFWALFLPLGERGSVDAALARRKEAASPEGGIPRDAAAPASRPPTSAPNTHLSLATAAFVLQVALIYWSSARQKTDPEWRDAGTAVYYVLNVGSIATPLGQAIGAYPALCRALTAATLLIEEVGPVLALLPLFRGALRLAAVVLFVGFHLALHLCLKLGPFSYVAIAAWSAFLPGFVWDKIQNARETSPKPVEISEKVPGTFPEPVEISEKLSGTFPEPVEISEKLSGTSPKPVEISEKLSGTSPKPVEISEKLSGTSPAPAEISQKPSGTSLPPVEISQRPSRTFPPPVEISQRPSGTSPPPVEISQRPSGTSPALVEVSQRASDASLALAKVFRRLQRISGAISLAALFVILWLNAGVLLGQSFRAPPALARASLAVGLHQEWGMFAPGPPKGDSWLVFEGTLSDGRQVDALGPGAPVDWERPFPSPFPGSPGENFTSSVIESLYEPERRYLARWICRRWDQARPAAERLAAIRIHYVVREIGPPGGAPAPLQSYLLWNQPCRD
jgi:hypothetical protein